MPTPMSFDDGPIGSRGYRPPQSTGAPRPWLLVSMLSSLLGLIFSGVSTSDFIEHLDRQVHSIHCSFIPGAGAEVGESGCRTVMMSPYSSVLRDSLWGGLPISLLAVAVFAYLVMKSAQFLLSKQTSKRETLYLVVATLLPVLMSVVYGLIAATQIGAVCKLCVGVYVASAVSFLAAALAHRNADASPEAELPMSLYARWFFEGVVYVVVLAVFYVLFAPTSPKTAQGCGTLVKKDDPAGIFIPMTTKGTPAIAVLDPLCPACKGFDERLTISGIDDKLAISAVLFPLDNKCNWMIKEAMHPGACAVSEAMLCDKEGALKILDWAFENQERLRETAKTDEDKVRIEIEEKFPKVKGCLGGSAIKNKLNKSLRWAVSNALPVLTPQLFVGDKRVCDEDTDLGLEYTVAKMLEGSSTKGRR